jgi:hypothetical protein
MQRIYKFLTRAASENKGDTPGRPTAGVSGADRCAHLLGLLQEAIKNLTDHRWLSASQLVWKAGKDTLSPLLKEQWTVRLHPHPHATLLLMFSLQVERNSGSTSRPFMTYVQDFILCHLTED